MDVHTHWSWLLIAALALLPAAGCAPGASGERLEAAAGPPAAKAASAMPAAASASERSPAELEAERAELEAVFREVIQPVLNEPIATESAPAHANSAGRSLSVPAEGQ